MLRLFKEFKQAWNLAVTAKDLLLNTIIKKVCKKRKIEIRYYSKVTFFVYAQQTLTTHRKPYNKAQLSKLLFKFNNGTKVFFFHGVALK